MPYRVVITDNAQYVFTNPRTAQEAEYLATKLFRNRIPTVTIEHLAPCQVNGICPFQNSCEHTCSDCDKEA